MHEWLIMVVMLISGQLNKGHMHLWFVKDAG